MDGEPKRKTQTETTLPRPSEPERVNKAVWTGNRMESDRSAYWSDGFRFFTFPQPFGFFLCSVEIISPWENIREENDIGNPCNLRQQGKAASAVTNLSDFKPSERTQEALLSTHWH